MRKKFRIGFMHVNMPILRGLCSETKLSTLYYPHNQLGQFIWVGIDGTVISYDAKNSSWVAKVQGKNTWATTEASKDSLLLGTHEWTVHNDPDCFPGPSRRVKLSLSYCQNSEFNCQDGSCIALGLRCDENTDCSDGSDEVGCKIVSIPANYNKDVTSNNQKSNLETTVEIRNILNIDENEGKIRISMGLTMGWHDSRLAFFNLKENSRLNLLDDAEFTAIWKPKVIFLNKEHKNFEEPVPEEIRVQMNTSRSYQLADYDILNSSKIYSGSSNEIYLTKQFR
jgi:Neurotransmitter-gated ion-channel ligand binding domain/Low-density lipoprotein receptor domain class A